MEVTRESDGLIRLTRLRLVNAYLVREDDGLTVVDSMISGSAEGILAAARELGAEIRRITITHDHSDHVGSLEALVAALPEAELVLPAREARIMRGERRREEGEPKDPPGKSRMPEFSLRAAREVAPGERIGSLEVVAAPGHSPGQVALLDTRDGTLIAGDAFSTVGGTVASSSRPHWRFPLPALATWDRPTALRTARALRELGPERLAVGHGPVIVAPVAQMDRAIAAAS